MALPHQPYGPLTTPQMSFLDDTFNALGALGVVPCTAAGTNAITLTLAANTPTISAYANFLLFAFVAANSSTSAVTLGVGSLAALNLYNNGGTVQSNNGDIVANQAYIVMYSASLNGGAGGFVIISAISSQSFVGGTLTVLTAMSGAALNTAEAAFVSAGTSNIGGAAANYLIVSGTATITAFDTVQAGTWRILKFTSTGGVLTNNASIIMPGSANYTWQAGDLFGFVTDGSGVWRVFAYVLANGKSLAGSTGALQQATFFSSGTFTTPTSATTATVYRFIVVGGGGGGGGCGNVGGAGASGGGSSGGVAIYYGSGVAGNTGITVTVGSGGSGGQGSIATGQNGSSGGFSSIVFNAVTVTGGSGAGGTGVANNAGNGVAGGAATGGIVNMTGGPGGGGVLADQNGVTFAMALGGPGGSNQFGQGGASNPNAAGGAGNGFGSGGSGGCGTSKSGGKGANGIVLVEWIQ